MTPRLLTGLALAGLLLPACTAVLGMDEAKLDESVGAAASGGSGGGSGGAAGQPAQPLVECTTARSDCKDCLNSCGADVDACVKNAQCRRTLTNYGGCLENGCLDSTGSCSEKLGGEADPLAQKIAECLTFECSNNGACVGTTVMSKCERYCACMQQNCPNSLGTWTTTQDCMSDCQLLDQRVQDCRGDHCEYGVVHQEHCIHAKGDSTDIMNPCKSAPPARHCLVKSDVKGPCQTSADCCPGLTCFNKECGD